MYLFVLDYHFVRDNYSEAIVNAFLEIASYAVIIYLNLWVLIPVFLQKKHFLQYGLAWGICIAAYIFLMRVLGLEQYFYEYLGWRSIFSMLLNTNLFLLLSLLYWYFEQAQIARERQMRLKHEKMEMELLFLRAQVSPHFMFNNLNNIYTLALQKHDNTAPMVARLSDILRYISYETEKNGVVLKKEIDMLKKYIDLQSLRQLRSNNIDFYTEGNLYEWEIVPTILLPFVENAFKHSLIDQDESAWIKINMEVDEQGKLFFEIGNKQTIQTFAQNESGIGIQNIQRQLALYYPNNKHQLSITSNKDSFIVCLTLQLTVYE